ncbi:zinc finger protein 184-like isoform X2 [Eleginops maclovinus]|uniref:zinc finger protein 184-like isoform X2 n=1 Tax=Eleginops maclovinus TaxID=56733 RepID=UPI003080ADE8
MFEVETLRAFVNERLTAAAEEIFEVFQRRIAEELESTLKENQRQKKLLDALLNPEVRLHRAGTRQQACSSSLEKEDPEPPHIKEEQEELQSSPEIEQEVTDTYLRLTSVKSEEEKAQSSWLNEIQTEENREAERTEADEEDCGGSDPGHPLQPATQYSTPLSSEYETDNSRNWEKPGLTPLHNNAVPGSGIKCDRSFVHKGKLQTRETLYRCPFCDYTSSIRSCLSIHLTVHEKANPHSSSVSSKREVVSNMRIHTVERPFKCTRQQECSSSLEKEDPEPPHIKEEQEELQSSPEIEQEVADTYLRLTSVKSEEEDEEKAQSSRLNEIQTEENREAERTEADEEDCGGSDPGHPLQPATQYSTPLSSEYETDDSRNWEKPGLTPLHNNAVPGSGIECDRSFVHKGKLQTRETPHSSSVCQQTSRREVVSNMRIHTGEKPCTRQQACSSSLEKEDPEPPHIKEEQEELQSSPEIEQEVADTYLRLTSVKSEEEDEEKAQSSRLNEIQTEENREAERTEADEEDCGGSHPGHPLQPATQYSTPLSSEYETDDSRNWEKPGLTPLHNNDVPGSGIECDRSFVHKGKLRKHPGETPHSSSVCQQTSRREVVSNRRIHTGEKPYKCTRQQACSSSLEKEDPEPPHIKEEQEELQSSPEIEQEVADTYLRLTSVKSEEEGEEKAQSSWLNEIQTEENREAERTEADEEDCGGSHPGHPLQPATQYSTPLSSEYETDDSRNWEKPGLTPLHNNAVPGSGIECDRSFVHKGKLQTRETPHSSSVCQQTPKREVVSNMRIHTGEKPFKCTVCSKSYSNKSNLRQHLTVHTGERPFSCSVCGKSFTYKSNLRLHSNVHTGEKPFSCSLCSKSFTTGSNLRQHLLVHTGERPFKCTFCSKSYTDKSSLKRHLTVHTGEKPFSCSVCGKSFSRVTSLTHHSTLHAGERPLKCTFCSKSFTYKSDLNRHLTVHTAEKPFSCSACSKSFTTGSNLRQHLLVHTGERPFKCTVCSKSFTTRRNLRQHLLVHTGERPYKCTVCSKSYNNKSNLRRHLTVHTGETV